MNKPGHRGDRSNPNAKLSTNEIANVSKSSNHVRRRTDTGNVRISTASGREKDYLIRDQQRYKNIKSENTKLDYMKANFCADKKKTK